jgi:hypothetical protein
MDDHWIQRTIRINGTAVAHLFILEVAPDGLVDGINGRAAHVAVNDYLK